MIRPRRGAEPPPLGYATRMITTAILVLGVGSLVGGALGWKLGRSYERLRGGKKTEATARARGGKEKTSR